MSSLFLIFSVLLIYFSYTDKSKEYGFEFAILIMIMVYFDIVINEKIKKLKEK